MSAQDIPWDRSVGRRALSCRNFRRGRGEKVEENLYIVWKLVNKAKKACILYCAFFLDIEEDRQENRMKARQVEEIEI